MIGHATSHALYSEDPKTGHLKTGNIRKPDILGSGLQMVRFLNGVRPFENWTKMSGFSNGKIQNGVQPFENRTKMSGFRMAKLKMSGF